MKTPGKHTSKRKIVGPSKPPRQTRGKPRDRSHGNSGARSGNGHHDADSHNAKQVAKAKRARVAKAADAERLLIYGVHTVRAALLNPKRTSHCLYATANGLERIADALPADLDVREVESRELQHMVGSEPVH
ncbi:MAG: RNA methyltransferase substrate-binding domain-containing protein, partial [Pseudomonadota bacterium]